MPGRVVEIETNDRHLAIKRGFLVVSANRNIGHVACTRSSILAVWWLRANRNSQQESWNCVSL